MPPTVIQKSEIKEEIGKNEVITVAQLNIDNYRILVYNIRKKFFIKFGSLSPKIFAFKV